MLNLSKIQLELERAKEKLRNVEEVIQKIEGKTFPNGPVRYGALKVELHSDKNRNPVPVEDSKNQKRRVIASAVDPRVPRLASDDGNFNLKRGLREKKESGVGLKRQSGDGRPQGVFARLSGVAYQQADEEDDEDFVKKPSLPSRVITTTSEAPSRQDVIAAQSIDEQSKQRNKRMFGALVGTLQKFRKEETRVREREEKRLKVEKKLEEDAKREKEKLMQEKRELFMEKKRREIEIKRIEWSLNRVKEYQAWEANVIPLKNFIQTQVKPHIFYLPSLHNSKTEERLVHSQKVVEKMIEKRKINLKEEIENSEKKARKTAAEEVEEEEAENIPEDNEALIAEQQMQVDFKTGNRENGFFEDAKTQAEISENIKDQDTGKTDDNWEENCQIQGKDLEPEAENDTEANRNKNEINEESLNSDSKVFDTKFININEKSLSGDTEENEAQINKSDYFSEKDGDQEKLAIGEEEKNASDDVNAGVCHEELSEEKVDCEVDEERSESTTVDYDINQELEKEKQETSGVDENKTVDNNSQNKIAENKAMGESDLNPEDGLKKKSESNTENKTAEKSRSREKSQSRKSDSSSRLRRSRSSKRRRRSTSRRKRSPRKRSRSKSPKNSRKSKSPLSKRSRRNKSPHSKPKRSSSRSSGSISPKKKKSGSSSSGSSKIN